MIIGENVVIRPMEIEDIEFIHQWWNNGEALEYCGLRYGFMMSRAAVENSFMPQIEAQEMYTEEKMFIICTKDDMRPIGDISYRNWNKRNRSAEIGIEICNPDDRGKGCGSDAMNIFIEFMFRQLNLHRIELTTAESNLRAQALYQRLGFRRIGLIRDNYYSPANDMYTNAVYMDLLRNEWDEIRERAMDEKE